MVARLPNPLSAHASEGWGVGHVGFKNRAEVRPLPPNLFAPLCNKRTEAKDGRSNVIMIIHLLQQTGPLSFYTHGTFA